MSIFPPEPKVNLYEEGFSESDILERAKVGTALSDLLMRFDDPVVVALDGQWGAGKTYFLKRWVGQHSKERNAKGRVVYFDAFAHDYVSDPLPALVSSLAERLPESKSVDLQKLKKTAFKLVKPLAKIGLSVASFGATQALNELGDAVVETVTSEAASSIDDFWAEEHGRHQAMEEFRAVLERLAAPPENQESVSPLIVVIDELDRCRPDYALEVLEVIKHFFSVPHVHFVLGVNLAALENSVRARYGDKIDAEVYLRKFIQLRLELPSDLGNWYEEKPASLVYLTSLMKELEINGLVSDAVLDKLALVSYYNEVSIRDVVTISSTVALALGGVSEKTPLTKGELYVLVDLIISKCLRPDLFPKFLNAEIVERDLSTYVGENNPELAKVISHHPKRKRLRAAGKAYEIWGFLSKAGKVSYETIENKDRVGRGFDDFGLDEGDAQNLPLRLYRKHLEVFGFYGR